MNGVVSEDVEQVFTLYGETRQCRIIVYTTIDFEHVEGHMDISFDPTKRASTLLERGLDFIDAPEVFAGHTYEWIDERFDYGEVRNVVVGRLRGRMVIVIWTPVGSGRRIISMRKANEREQARYGKYLG